MHPTDEAFNGAPGRTTVIASPRTSTPSPPSRRWRTTLLALTIYGLGSWAFFYRPGFFDSRAYMGVGSDPTAFMWFLKWWPYAVTHNLNPFLTRAVWSPSGFNLAWATSVPSLAFAAWPLTALCGPVVSFNALTLMAPPLTAFAGFLLCREIANKFWPALIGGWLLGYSSYELGQAGAHLNLDFVAAIPLVLWLTVLRYKGKLAPQPFIALAAFTLLFEFGVSTEIFATATCFFLPAFLIAYVQHRSNRGALRALARDITFAYIVCLIFAAPFLYFFFLGRATAPALIQPRGVYVADLLNYVIPTPITALGGSWAHYTTRHFTGNYREEGAYLGIFLLTALARAAFVLRKNAWARLIVILFAGLVVCSFGPSLHILGHPVMRMPWLLIQKLPLLGDALPVRVTLYVFLTAALMMALWLASLTGRQAIGGYALATLSLVSLLPNIHKGVDSWYTPLRIPAFFRFADRDTLRPQENVVVLPYGMRGDSMLWQAASTMRFRMAGGYVGFTPTRFMAWPAVRMLYTHPLPGFRNQMLMFCKAHHVGAIIIGPGAGKTWAFALNRLNWRHQTVGQVTVYHVPESTVRSSKNVTATQAATSFLLSEITALRGAASCYRKTAGSLARLTPRAAERIGCLDPAYGGFPTTTPNKNWTSSGGWLGVFGPGVGVGVWINGRKEARNVIAQYRFAQTIYFPYPAVWNGTSPVSPHESGQLLLVFPR